LTSPPSIDGPGEYSTWPEYRNRSVRRIDSPSSPSIDGFRCDKDNPNVVCQKTSEITYSICSSPFDASSSRSHANDRAFRLVDRSMHHLEVIRSRDVPFLLTPRFRQFRIVRHCPFDRRVRHIHGMFVALESIGSDRSMPLVHPLVNSLSTDRFPGSLRLLYARVRIACPFDLPTFEPRIPRAGDSFDRSVGIDATSSGMHALPPVLTESIPISYASSSIGLTTHRSILPFPIDSAPSRPTSSRQDDHPGSTDRFQLRPIGFLLIEALGDALPVVYTSWPCATNSIVRPLAL
jgi:hypothetical protein